MEHGMRLVASSTRRQSECQPEARAKGPGPKGGPQARQGQARQAGQGHGGGKAGTGRRARQAGNPQGGEGEEPRRAQEITHIESTERCRCKTQ